MVRHIVGCAAQRDLPDRPWSIIGEVCRQDTDPQFTLGVQWVAKSDCSGMDKGRANEHRPPQMFSSSVVTGYQVCCIGQLPGEAKALAA